MLMKEEECVPKNFIEGSQKPGEEPAYWRLFRGELVSLRAIEQQGQLYGIAVEGMIARGEARLQVIESKGENTAFVYLQKKI